MRERRGGEVRGEGGKRSRDGRTNPFGQHNVWRQPCIWSKTKMASLSLGQTLWQGSIHHSDTNSWILPLPTAQDAAWNTLLYSVTWQGQTCRVELCKWRCRSVSVVGNLWPSRCFWTSTSPSQHGPMTKDESINLWRAPGDPLLVYTEMGRLVSLQNLHSNAAFKPCTLPLIMSMNRWWMRFAEEW